jgi:hypothetical protein
MTGMYLRRTIEKIKFDDKIINADGISTVSPITSSYYLDLKSINSDLRNVFELTCSSTVPFTEYTNVRMSTTSKDIGVNFKGNVDSGAPLPQNLGDTWMRNLLEPQHDSDPPSIISNIASRTPKSCRNHL